MRTPPLHEEREWPYVLTLLPRDLENSAWESEALRRCRHIPDAQALLRLALAYAVSDLSLKDVAAWAHALGVAEITGPGLFYRLREAEGWLQRVLAQTLQGQVESAAGSPLRLRVVDATVLHGPGAKGTEWRAHVLMDAGTGMFRAVELTDARGGEGYGRYRVSAQEVILGDRAYATARGLWAVYSAHADVVARLNPHTIRVCDEQRKRLALGDKEKEVPQIGGIEFTILVPIPPEKRTKTRKWGLRRAIAWVPARAVAARTRDGSVIWLLTTLSAQQASWQELMQLYRLRWQIELFFKRLKSLLHLDTLPSRQGPTAKSWMLARFLAAALAQRLVQPAGPLSPWGYELSTMRLHPERLVAVPHEPLGAARSRTRSGGLAGGDK
jgi:Transposase DDE domain